jgi:hypothetical protein
VLEEVLHVDAEGFSRSTGVQVAGLRPCLGLRTPARIGEMTSSRRASRAAMVRAASPGTW